MASPEEHQNYFDALKNALLLQRGIPKEQQIRELLKEYYDMRQGASERVCDFVHRFVDVQTELAKLIPNIHYTSDGKDLELQYAFDIKLRSDLQTEIISREFKYLDLQEIIQIAERYEKIHFPSNAKWEPDALYSKFTANPKSKTPLSSSKTIACRYCKNGNHTSNNCSFKPESAAQHLPPPQKTTRCLHLSQKQLFTTCFTRQTVNYLMARVTLIASTDVLFANNSIILHIHQLFIFSQHQSQVKQTLFCSS